MKKVKYGLFSYSTENIGDEVQSLAARRFLPRVDYYFDRDDIDSTKISENEEVRIIMNGWFTHKPENWPPKNPSIKPLLVAMHVEQDALDGLPAKSFISKESKEFLSKHGPVGARNYPTFELLENNNIDVYFSGCVTLTLNPDSRIKKQSFILAVDVSEKVLREIKSRTKRPVISLNTIRSVDFSLEEKYSLAEFWLFLYQSAHAVITTRLHSMLPCLALGTPVFGISGRDPKRYRGLIDLVNHSTEKEFIENKSLFNLDNPKPNPEDYLKIRKELEKTCSNFTGFDSKLSFLYGKSLDESFLQNDFFLQAVCRSVLATIEKDYLNGDLNFARKLNKAHEKRIKKLEEELQKKQNAIDEMLAKIDGLENPGIRDASLRLKKAVVRRVRG
ncbi:polysaccharide pyruvyl transferase family protein [Candidatus Saccharibacteria bacterium]|nr:polysaccharide pyruvyl transferase family protein [Candidatus Saccharibacteria bacterium]